MSLGEHIRELRSRLVRAVVAIALGVVVGWLLFDRVWELMTDQFCALEQSDDITGECNLVVNGIFSGFFIHLKVATIIGVILASPIWLYQIWAFVTPGLHRRERRWTITFLALAVPLFVLGSVLAYVTLPKGLELLLGFTPDKAVNFITIDSYLGYLVTMLLVFGVSFEFPLMLGLLNLAGILGYQRMKAWWRPMVLGIFVFAAVATPSPDPITMSVLAVPMCVFYGIAVLVARVRDIRLREHEAASPFAGLGDDEAAPLEA
jgi:sec-independent protein translocase protein TatC